MSSAHVERILARMVVPSVMLPAQMDTTPQRGWLQRLMSAALDDAYRRLRANTLAGHEAREWFRSSDRDSPFSFLTICEVLELDPWTYRRAAAVVWKKRIVMARINRRSTGKSDTRRIG